MPYYIMQKKTGIGSNTDPYWSNVQLLTHMDGVNNGTTFTDEKGHTISRVGNPVTSTTQSKFGGASGYITTGNFLRVPSSTDFDFGAVDVTIEGWVYPTSLGVLNGIVSNRRSGETEGWHLMLNSSGQLTIGGMINGNWYNGIPGFVTTSSTASINTWTHIAMVKTSTAIRLFVNGVMTTSGALTSFPSYVSLAQVAIGNTDNAGTQGPFNGYIDDLRITKGVARYTSNFTPPTAAFPNS